MRLYRYRRFDRAIQEIDNHGLYFPSTEQLNDPVEGYLRVFFQGDISAWEGLFRNYIISLALSIQHFLLALSFEDIQNRIPCIDLDQFNGTELRKILEGLADAFLDTEQVKVVLKQYSENEMRVSAKELEIRLIPCHMMAMKLCVSKFLELHLIEEEFVNALFQLYAQHETLFHGEQFMIPEESQRNRDIIAAVISDTVREMMEYFSMIRTLTRVEQKDALDEEDRANLWMKIQFDYPNLYVSQLKAIIYPDCYIVCFSKSADQSSMWGNYGDNHRGICFIYEMESDYLEVENTDHALKIPLREVNYLRKEPIERNFFESLGRLTQSQLNTWLSGKKSISRYYNSYGEQKWRDSYWERFMEKNLSKLPDWKHEMEVRAIIENSFFEYDSSAQRVFYYDRKIMKGIIFGINTPLSDKIKIFKKLQEIKEELSEEFSFYQADYDELTHKICVNREVGWTL